MVTWYTSTHATSLFVTTLVAGCPAPDRRYALRNNQLSTHFSNGESEKHTLATLFDLRSTLSELFGLNLSNIPDLDNRLEELLATLVLRGV
ncbi:MAG: arylamine N-acetyltransferase [Ardenticatenaceae bacterium]